MAEFSGRLSQAPVVYALCELRFSPILKMAEMVPDIQERLRANYEEFEEERITGVKLEQGGQTSVQSDIRWRFEDANRRSGFVLYNASFVYHTTAYGDFEDFAAATLQGFAAVDEVAKVRRLHRVGLRYVDLIEGRGDVSADHFVHPLLRGFGNEIEAREQVSQYVFSGLTTVGRLTLRATRSQHELPLPPDLLPGALKPARAPKADSPSFFLDTDHATENKAVVPSDLEKILRDLKAPISAAFKRAITEKAVAAWK